jgi:hypothetical protein
MALETTDQEVENGWREEAKARGVTVDVVLGEALSLYRQATHLRAEADAMNRDLDRLADLVPETVPPIPGEFLRRERLYDD